MTSLLPTTDTLPVLTVECADVCRRQQVDSKSKELQKRKSMEVRVVNGECERAGRGGRPTCCSLSTARLRSVQLYIPSKKEHAHATATDGIQFGVLLLLGLLG